MKDQRQIHEKMLNFDCINESKLEKLILFTKTAESLPKKKLEAVVFALMAKIAIEEKILPIVKVSETYIEKLQYAILDGYVTLEVNEEGKPVLTFKSDKNCRIEEIARILACNSKIKIRHMPILKCGLREVSINAKRGVDVNYDYFEIGDDFKRELEDEIEVILKIMNEN